MNGIDENFIDAMAPNANAIKNGRKLVGQKKFFDHSITDDGSIVFGKCSGSGKSAYECSVDFVDPAKPVSRCSCPSRQFPCKHCLGLLYAWVQAPGDFKKAELPDDVASKREKAVKRAAKKKANEGKPKPPRKVNLSALKKKLTTQIEALGLLDDLLRDMLNQGLGTHGQKAAASLADKAAQLRAAYLPGAELAIMRLSNTVSTASQARQYGGEDSSITFRRWMSWLGSKRWRVVAERTFRNVRRIPNLNPKRIPILRLG